MSFYTSRSLLLVSALTALSPCLPAVDGLILIDQKAGMAGKVTPQDAPGFPVTITQSGSYRLTGNLEVHRHWRAVQPKPAEIPGSSAAPAGQRFQYWRLRRNGLPAGLQFLRLLGELPGGT